MMNNKELIDHFQSTLSKELTADLAKDYVVSLTNHLHESYPSKDLVQAGSEWHSHVGQELFGPLINGYCLWLADKCKEIGYSGPVYFAMRDASPLITAAKILWSNNGLHPVEIYANRPLLGIEDEISPEASKVNGNMQKYLADTGVMNSKNVVWSDTGAWGTVIQVLKENVLNDNQRLFPFFWYSHNPHIPGYINELCQQAGISESIGEVLNDTLECVFPQKHTRPTELLQTASGWRVNLVPSGELSIQWGEAALIGVRNSAKNHQTKIGNISPQHTLTNLIHAHKQAKNGSMTGVLPTNTPTWSKGQEFIEAWPKDLLP